MSVVDKLYIPLAKSVDLPPDEDGTLRYHLDEKNSVVVKVDEKPLVMPLPARLRGTGLNGVVAFHPLSENIIRGESPVLRKLRTAIINKVTNSVSILALSMVEIAADVDTQQKLKASESDFLRTLPNADPKLVNAFAKIVDNITAEGNNRLVRVFFKRGGMWKGKKYSRVAVVSFPIIEAAHAEGKEIFGVKLRVADKTQIQALLDFILPNSGEEEETYNYGSSSKAAPYFDALLGAYLNIANAINKHAELLKNHLESYDDIVIDTSWADELKNLDKLALEIPPLAGNDGDVGLEEQHQVDVATAASTASDMEPVERPTVNLGMKFADALNGDVGKVTSGPAMPTVTPTTVAPVHHVSQPTTVAPQMPSVATPGPVTHYQPTGYGTTPAHNAPQGGTLKWNQVQDANNRPVQHAPAPQYRPAQQQGGYPGSSNGYGQPQQNGYGYSQPQQRGYGYPNNNNNGYGYNNDPGRATPTYS